MSYRGTAWLFLLAAALTAYNLIFERGDAPWSKVGKVFPQLEPADILKLEIERRDGGEPREAAPPILLERSGAYDWRMRKPFEFPCFLARVQGLVWEIADLVQYGKIAPGSEGHGAAIPAGGPELVVRFATRSGREHRMEFGRDFPASSDYFYVRIDGEVMMVRQQLRKTFAVSVNDLRSRALVAVAPPDAVYLRVEDRGGKFSKVLARRPDSSSWLFGGDPALEGTLADHRLVHELLVELNSWQVQSFEKDGVTQGAELAPYGLESPRFVVEVKHQDGPSRSALIEIGKRFDRAGEELVYLRHRGEPYVFAAAAAPLAWLEREAEELRTRFALDLGVAEVERVEARGSGQAYVLERIAAAAGDEPASHSWNVVDRRLEQSFPGDRSLVEVALAELRQLLIQKFLPSGGEGAGEEMSVTLHLDNGTARTVRFGARSSDPRDAGLELYEASRADDRSRFLVESLWPVRIAAGGHAFRERRISQLVPADLFELQIRIAGGSRRWNLGRLPGTTWSFDAEEVLLPGKELDQERVNKLVLALGRERFRVEEFLPSLGKEEHERLGLGASTYRQEIRFGEIEGNYQGFRRLTLGGEAGGRDSPGQARPRRYYARADTVELPFTLSAEVPELLASLVEHLQEITAPR
jgi:hypothetical protein